MCLLVASVAHAQQGQAELYLESARLFRAEKYNEAVAAFAQFFERFPESRFAPDAVFKIGESHYRLGDFEEAGGYFRLYLERYALGRNAPDARFRLEQCESVAGKRIDAVHPRMKLSPVPLRAVVVDEFMHPTLLALDRDLARLKSEGANAIVVPAFVTKGGGRPAFLDRDAPPGALFPTDAMPVCLDVLARISSMAHKYRLRLIVRLPVRTLPGLVPDTVWDPLAEKTRAGERGDLYSPANLERIQRIAGDLAAVSIDGILVETLGLSPLEGYGPQALLAYQAALGAAAKPKDLIGATAKSDLGTVTLTPAPQYSRVAQAKADQVTRFARSVAQAARKKNPNLLVWTRVSFRTAQDPAEGLLWEAQRIEQLATTPLSGVFFEVDFRKDLGGESLTRKERFDSIRRLCRGASLAVGDPARMVVGLHVRDSLTRKTVPELQVEALNGAVEKIGPVGLTARPLMLGFDYSKLFEQSGTPSASEKKGEAH